MIASYEFGRPSTASVHKILNRIFISDIDFEAFCICYFPEIKKRFSTGMEKGAKINLLVEHVSADDILTRLQQHIPSALEKYAHFRWSISAKEQPLIEDELQTKLRNLICKQLPLIISRTHHNPLPLTIRAGVNLSEIANQASSLDAWTLVCAQLVELGIPGLVMMIKIVEKAQEEAFSEWLSKWSAVFLESLLGYAKSSNDYDLKGIITSFIRSEADRWHSLMEQISRDDPGNINENPDLFVKYVTSISRGWTNASQILGGPEEQYPHALPQTAVLPEQGRPASVGSVDDSKDKQLNRVQANAR